MSLSLCMIVKNEEKNLNRCLESVKDIVDEIIIVDTGSTDNTIKIAEKYNAKIFHYKWDNSFANARNYSLSKASKDWILIMDADDELVSEDKEKLLNLINNKNIKLNAFLGETLSYSGDSPDHNIYSNLNIRLIRNGKGYKFQGDIHEQIIPGIEDRNKEGIIGISDIRFYHYGYLTKTVYEGDSPIFLREILGVGTYRPYFLLGNIYCAIGDLDGAFEAYEKSLKLNPKLNDALFKIAEIMASKNISTNEIKKKLESYIDNFDEETNLLFSNIFYKLNDFHTAYDYIKKAEEINKKSQKIIFHKGIYLFYLGRYKEALRELYKVIDEKYYNPSVYCCILCELFTKNYNQVEKLLKITEEFNEPEERMVYKSFISI